MRNKILKMLISILLLITLTSANFILLGVTSVTYAVDQLSLDSNTNHKNISFMAYFKEGENKEEKHSIKADATEVMLYLQISVKQEGYFNGSISLANSNFKFKKDTKHERIQSITEDTINLNQIVSGETIEIPVGINLLKDTNFDVSLLTAESKLKLQGTYTYGTRPDTKKITGERTVQLKLISPYESGKEGIFLNQTVLTNKVFQLGNGVNAIGITPSDIEVPKGTTPSDIEVPKGTTPSDIKVPESTNTKASRIIQLQVETGMQDNLYPIKTEKVELQAPKLNSAYPTSVLVQTPNALAMNGRKIQENEYKYNAETGTLTIEVNNEEKDGKVVWNKTGTDKYIVTYIFAGTEEIEQQDLSAKSEISLYDANKTVARYTRTTTLSTKELDSSITVSLSNTENEIYKGAIYEGIEREITQNINVNINLVGNMDKIQIREELPISTIKNIQTKSVTVNLDNLIDMLGEDGSISVVNKATNEVLNKVTGKTQLQEGTRNAVLELPRGTQEILIETSKPQKSGILSISTTKIIPEQDFETKQSLTEIRAVVSANYTLGGLKSEDVNANSVVTLKETQTYATLELSRTEFSTMRTNENVEMRITLHSNNEKYELYKNPHIKLTFPEEFAKVDNGINITSMNLLNEEELKIKDAAINGNSLDIELIGEQTAYKGVGIDGATILIVANLTADRKQKNVNTQFVLEYENEKALHYADDAQKGTQVVNSQIVSYAGIIATNAISEYGIETINNEGNDTAKLQLSTEQKSANVLAQVINNYETAIEGVSILGTFPTEKAMEENNIKIAVGNLQLSGIDSSRIKVYYSENEKVTADTNNPSNNWKDNISNAMAVKKYLIVIDKLNSAEEIDFSYAINIPEGLEYNKVASEEYAVNYNKDTLKGQIMQAHKLRLETGIGPELTTTVETYVGNEKAKVAKEGEKIEYVITTKNTGSVTVENIQLKGLIPEGTIYMEEIPVKGDVGDAIQEEIFKEDSNKKEVTFEGIKLAPGEEITKTYIVKVQKGTVGKVLKNIIGTNYAEINKNSDAIETTIETGKVEVDFGKGIYAFDNMISGKTGRFRAFVKNISDKDLKNINLKVNIENAKIVDISYLKDKSENSEVEILKDVDNVTIPEILKGERIEIDFSIQINYFTEPGRKQVTIQPVAIVDKEEYKANREIIDVDPLLVRMSNTSQNENQYVKAGENITYKIDVTNIGTTTINEMLVRDRISPEEVINSVKINEKELKNDEYSTSSSLEDGGTYINIVEPIKSGETRTYMITTEVDAALDNSKAVEIDNTADIYAESTQLATAMVSHIIEPSDAQVEGDISLDDIEDGNNDEVENPTDSTNPEGSNGQNTGTLPGGNGQSGQNGENNSNAIATSTKLISGYAWLDKNENGQRDSEETLLDGITVKLFNTETNELQKNSEGNLIQTTTNSTGMYTLSEVPQGTYLVVFEFNNSKYALTTYEKQGVSSEKNSKVISREMTIDGEPKTVAVSEAITVTDEHISYINMGLKERKVYDMKLEKMITRVIVQNSEGTETTQFQDTTLAKVDIHAKQLSSSNVVVDYKIRVTNEGETEGYIKNIVDYVSPDFKFSSELNKDWYQSGSNIYNSSLANTKLLPGESKEVTLTLTKQMTENNTGTIANTAEIIQSYNEQGLKDSDSVEGNKAKGEDDMSQADLIISIKTGEIVATVAVIITIIVVLAIGSFIIIKKVMKPIGI